MAGDWIKFRTSLLRDGRVLKLSRSNATNVTTVVGALVTLWCYGDEQADQNGVLEGYSKGHMNDLLGIPNFIETLPECWIDHDCEWVKLPNYQEHNGETAKKRASDQKRQQKSRKTVTVQSDKVVTREEKRREENKESKKKKFTPPTVDQVEQYFIDNGYTKESGKKAFSYYEANNWKDSNDKPVKAWKQKMISVWFKPENKSTEDQSDPFKLAVAKAKELGLEPFRGMAHEQPETTKQFMGRVNGGS